jgi:CRISPR-associated exonuclease Cas4
MCIGNFSEEDYLMLSGVSHFSFCPRRWGLIHLEDQWRENYLTATGRILHEKTDAPFARERRGGKIVTRAMRLLSHRLKIAGQADTVEFYCQPNDGSGVALEGEAGLWLARPVEYKRGRAKTIDCDRLQLCAQALCLEEMLGVAVLEGDLFYWETRRRETVPLTSKLRSAVIEICDQMWAAYVAGVTPPPRRGKHCRACSLSDICLPALPGGKKVSDYLSNMLED